MPRDLVVKVSVSVTLDAMKNLKKMTLGKANTLRLEVSEAWNHYIDNFRPADWLATHNEERRIQKEIWDEAKKTEEAFIHLKHHYVPFKEDTKHDCFPSRLISAERSARDHEQFLLENEFDDHEIPAPLNTEGVVAFIDTDDDYANVMMPIFAEDSKEDVLCKISTTVVWAGEDKPTDYPNPFLSGKALMGWSLGVKDGRYFVGGPQGLAFEFEPFEKLETIEENMAGNKLSIQLANHALVFDNNDTYLLLSDASRVAVPLAVFSFVVANSLIG